MYGEIIILRRDCDALLIPSGAKISLPKGTEVTISQALGGTYTVGVYGNLARIDGKDADALGKEIILPDNEASNSLSLEDQVWEQLRTCYDPEIPVNIVDLGLIYQCTLSPLPDQPEQHQADIQMTLTAPGCGMGPVLAADVKQKLLAIPGIVVAEVNIVFDPPWDQSRMSDAAKLQLGML
ncbi:MAG: putative Fe-S cluster assembly protein SufT [Coxiellaceae bacterium]|nr:MAG: putative Fe-S cluster assembly protein SufT [Coxiellaceae bacterium]